MTAALPLNALSPPAWKNLQAAFARLLELPAEARQNELVAVTRQSPALADQLRELLAQHDAEEADGGAFLASPALLLPTWREPERSGQRLGPWVLTNRLGHGGMGEVWEARRADGAYEARVAVKVLRGTANSAAMLAHFAQEQRLLARLNHPNIARLLDAGRTPDDDQPYFVLEAVDGQSIDAACRGRPLSARLALFLQLADAVTHAHRQQLVHRDLKPANVLVTADDQVKLLDFGIAQALDAQLEVQAEAGPAGAPARQTQRALTPAYASPEQVRGEALGPATDVYSLGVLLHLLLTGTRPYGQDMASPQAVMRAVLDATPTPPSQATAAPDADPGVPRPLLVGDLDAIVARALAKPLGQRYASVSALADDLRAHLAGLPVSARPRTPVYLATRYLRRNRVAVLASALALLAVVAGLGATAWQARDAVAALALLGLVTGLGFSTWQARAAAAARDEARARLAQTSELVRDIVMRYADTVTYLPGGLRMKGDLLKDTIAYLDRLGAGAVDDALLAGERAKALARLASMQLEGADATLDEPQEAARNAEQALALFPEGESAHRDDPLYYKWWLRALSARQNTQRHNGDVQAALDTAERERSLLQAVMPRFPGDINLLNEQGSNLIGLAQVCDTWMVASLNQPERALRAFDEAELAYLQLLDLCPEDGTPAYQLGTVCGGRAIVHQRAGRLEVAAEQGRQAVAWRETALAREPGHVAFQEGVAGEINNLARTLVELGCLEEAVGTCERGDALMHALVTDDPGNLVWPERRRFFAFHHGRALRRLGRTHEALPLLQGSLQAMQNMPGASAGVQRRKGWCELEIAQALHSLGRMDEAHATGAAALATLQAVLAGLKSGQADPETQALFLQVQQSLNDLAHK
jgi:eukaryotic-like serine/threonine-protein kinase